MRKRIELLKLQEHVDNIENGIEYWRQKWITQTPKPLTDEEHNKIDDLIWKELEKMNKI